MQMAVGEALPAAVTHDEPQSFLSDIGASRTRTRAHIAKGATMSTAGADRGLIVTLLNEALASEIACMLRYRRHYFMLRDTLGEAEKGQLLDRANEEQLHADLLAQRITQLGGEPDLSPLGICDLEYSRFAEGNTPEDMVREELTAEQMAVESYGEMIHYVGDSDPATRRMLEEILANEIEHAGELTRMLDGLGGTRA
jgi:bacterioferritin